MSAGTSAMSTFDWGAFFSAMSTIIVAVFVPWLQIKMRAAEKLIERNTEITKATADRSEELIEKVVTIQAQTDGMSKHLERVALERGLMEGARGANRRASKADAKAMITATSASDQLKVMEESGDFAPGTFKDVAAELDALLDGFVSERKRKDERK